jgi:PilZ domain
MGNKGSLQPAFMKDRNSTRRRTFKGGSISFSHGVYECLIRNLSDSGACLEVEHPTAIPDSFTLIIKPECLKRGCEVAWREPRRIGVRFV